MRDKLANLPQATILQLIYQQKSYEGMRATMNSPPIPCTSTGRTAMRTQSAP